MKFLVAVLLQVGLSGTAWAGFSTGLEKYEGAQLKICTLNGTCSTGSFRGVKGLKESDTQVVALDVQGQRKFIPLSTLNFETAVVQNFLSKGTAQSVAKTFKAIELKVRADRGAPPARSKSPTDQKTYQALDALTEKARHVTSFSPLMDEERKLVATSGLLTGATEKNYWSRHFNDVLNLTTLIYFLDKNAIHRRATAQPVQFQEAEPYAPEDQDVEIPEKEYPGPNSPGASEN